MEYAHTCIRVKDLDRSITFYTEDLPYKLNRKLDFPDNGFTLAYLSLPGEKSELELTYNYGHKAYDLGDGYGHIALFSQNLEEDYRRLKERGCILTDLKALPGEKAHYFFVTDPDGYKIEIIRK